MNLKTIRNVAAGALVLFSTFLFFSPSKTYSDVLQWSTALQKKPEIINLLDPTPEKWEIGIAAKSVKCLNFSPSTPLSRQDLNYLGGDFSLLPIKEILVTICPASLFINIIDSNGARETYNIRKITSSEDVNAWTLNYLNGDLTIQGNGVTQKINLDSLILINTWPGASDPYLNSELSVTIIKTKQTANRLLVLVFVIVLSIFLANSSRDANQRC